MTGYPHSPLRRPVSKTDRQARAALIVALAAMGLPIAAAAQSAAPPPLNAQVRDALKRADSGDPAPLTALAESGNADAQYYAGVMYIFGRGAIPKDVARGCAYEQKASAARADAMHLVGMCRQSAGDKVQAEAAYIRAAQMGFPKSKCALGQMLLTDPSQAQRGLALCQEAGNAGDLDAQIALGDAYYDGAKIKRDPAAARKWYEMAAKQNNVDAMRRLGEMNAKGDGGRKDTKKAMKLWTAAEKAGDPLAAILVADQMFSDVTGGRQPGPGTYAFKGGVPSADLQVIEEWYRLAADKDPRAEVKQRAQYALSILSSLKTGATARR